MADADVTDLTTTTTPAITDLGYIVVDPAGTPLDRKVTLANLLKANGAGFVVIDRANSRRTAGSLSLTATNWADVDTGTDLTLSGVQTGDEIDVAVSFTVNSVAVNSFFDVVTVVSASPVNAVGQNAAAPTGATGEGVGGWVCNSGLGVSIGGPVTYTLQSGDISGGNVLLRLRYRDSAATARTLVATTDRPMHFKATAHRSV